jgi:hypothetical protein
VYIHAAVSHSQSPCQVCQRAPQRALLRLTPTSEWDYAASRTQTLASTPTISPGSSEHVVQGALFAALIDRLRSAQRLGGCVVFFFGAGTQELFADRPSYRRIELAVKAEAEAGGEGMEAMETEASAAVAAADAAEAEEQQGRNKRRRGGPVDYAALNAKLEAEQAAAAAAPPPSS